LIFLYHRLIFSSLSYKASTKLFPVYSQLSIPVAFCLSSL
jgi:hypothetical protein